MGGTAPYSFDVATRVPATAATSVGHKKVFVGGLSWETDEKSLRDYFGRYGTVSDCVIMRDRHTGHPRGFGFVTYDDEAVADRVAAERHELDGRQVEAKRAVPRSECAPAARVAHARATKKVFVGGLPATCGQEQIVDYFSRFGEIADAQVMYDHHTGNSRGFGFVTFVSEATVDRVVECDDHDIMGKFVDVKRAEPRQVLDARRAREPTLVPTTSVRSPYVTSAPTQSTAAPPPPPPPFAPLHWPPHGGLGMLEQGALYSAQYVHANLYGAAGVSTDRLSRPVASARAASRYHPYRARVARSYR